MTQREIQLRRNASDFGCTPREDASSASAIPLTTLPDPTALLAPEFLQSELDFYLRYRWTLNPFPTFFELVTHLKSELRQLDETLTDWQQAEVMTNVFLLGCQLSDTIDDFGLGKRYDFSKISAAGPFAAPVLRGIKRLLETPERLRALQRDGLWKWREAWEVAMVDFLKNLAAGEPIDRSTLLECGKRLASLLEVKFPASLDGLLPRIPSAFSSKDITHFDVLELGRRLVAAFPERQLPILVVGIRSAGSHFAPLLRAYLEYQGYEDLDGVTLRPKRGVGSWERVKAERCAEKKGLAVVMDESPATGSTLALTVKILRGAGVLDSNIMLLLPIHPAGREWKSQLDCLSLSSIRTFALEPEEWHKHRVLEPQCAESRLEEYFISRGYLSARVVESEQAARFNGELQDPSNQQWSTRLKRGFEVRLDHPSGQTETRYVLAKSVGWGWLAYRALIAAAGLARFVPPTLGLRDGILYSEWIPQDPSREQHHQDRARTLDTLASYVAARTRELRLETDPSARLCLENRDNGYQRLATVLGGAYGWKPTAFLKRPRIRQLLLPRTNPVAVLIDGRMRPREWVAGPSSLLKTDFSQHGLGKHPHNLVDPAYDLADAILHFRLSPEEERTFLDRYVAESGDAGVRERLFPMKILAADWAMTVSRDQLQDPRLASQHPQWSEECLHAWTFLVIHATRFCGSLCTKPEQAGWHSPLAILDVDGVLDRNVFGFPSTTAAGIQAVSLLHAHGFAVALNTARDIGQVRDYCQAYGFAGGIAEHGACLWDARAGRERVLISTESAKQMEKLRTGLRQIPGVFVDDRYHYSIRALMYEDERSVRLPMILIRNLMESLGVDRLGLKQNETDTTIVAKNANKGTGLRALLEWIGQPDIETVAIGDTFPDLPMFRVAKRSFAPAQISCREAARAVGCQIAPRPYQPGLLDIARSLVHPDGRRCARCQAVENAWPPDDSLFVKLLEAADRKRPALLLQALFDPMALRNFDV